MTGESSVQLDADSEQGHGNHTCNTNEENLLGKSSDNLRQMVVILSGKLKSYCNEIADLKNLLILLKEENVKLSRNLKWVHSKNEELTAAMRKFFNEPARADWIKQNQEDTELGIFIQRAVAWYRLITKEDNATLNFYRMVWMYEREEEVPIDPCEDEVKERSSSTASVDSYKWDRSPKNESSGNGQKLGFPSILERTSANLYDVCRERLKNTQLQQENARLESEHAALRDANARLEKELQEITTKEVPSVRHTSYQWDNEDAPRPAKSSRTLAELAANDSMWNRLLEDSELFSSEDVIDEAYEKFLHDLLLIMSAEDCSFKKAIELLDGRGTGVPSSGERDTCTVPATGSGDVEPLFSPAIASMTPGRPLRLPQAQLDDIVVKD